MRRAEALQTAWSDLPWLFFLNQNIAVGIRVNAVSPGVIKTPMHGRETYDFLAKLQPVGRMGESRDIVDAVLYLESAGFVTGEILHVDG
jgi:NAD(P)-dependent dehydrogenase (short-subunit alcohol dehydrogenase family)